jgi:hypothetical protein
MTSRMVQIDLLTASYRIVGELEVSSGGVLGVMSDLTTSTMEIHDANLARLHMATNLVEQAPSVRVIKNQAAIVCLGRREDVGPHASSRAGYVRVQKYPLRITTPVFEIDGTLEWPGRFDFSTIISDGTSNFIPLFDASVGAILFPTLLFQTPALLLNRNIINTLILKEEKALLS